MELPCVRNDKRYENERSWLTRATDHNLNY